MSSSQVDLPLHHHSPHHDTSSPLPPVVDPLTLGPAPPDVLPDPDAPDPHISPSSPPPPPPLPPTLPELPAADFDTANFSHSLETMFGRPPPSAFPSSLQSRPQEPRSTRPVAQEVQHMTKMHRRASVVQRRQSNVLKLSEENDKLKEELRAMTERLEAAERRRQELESRRGK
ncbi:hypothetical protein BC826DRAFT_505162 [Russula brevipes]|nr:hypothetical protein BC826DRAFT_505162 [Russula brevipes]